MIGLGVGAVCRVPGAVLGHVSALEVLCVDRLLVAVVVDAPVGVVLINMIIDLLIKILDG